MSEEIKFPETVDGLTAKEIEDNSVASLRSIPGRSSTFGAPQKTAKEVQEAFDALPKLVAGKVNDIINGYNALVAAAKAIDDKADGIAGDLDAEAAKREEDLAKKLDIPKNTTGGNKALVSRPSGAVTLLGMSPTPIVGELAMFSSRNTLSTSTATGDTDAVPLAQLRALLQSLKDELLGGASGAYDTLKELEDALKDNDSDVVAILKAIAAVEASLAGKVDTKDVSTTDAQNTIAKRAAGGRLSVGRAATDTDAVPYKQMREELERYLADGGGLPPDLLDGITNAIKMIDTLEAKVANLEAGLATDMFTVDDTTAYVKTIPADAAPYAELRSVGGMTHKVEQSTPVPINTDVVDDYDLGFVDVSADGYIWVSNYMYSGWGVSFGEFFPTAIIGKKYKFTAKSGGEGDLTQANVTTSVPLDLAFTLAEGHLSSSVWFNIGYDDDGAAGQPVGGTYTLTLVEVTDALVYTPVTALDIKDASGNVTNTFTIPAAVQALDGYGKTGYGIEWDDDGKPWWVTPDARTDISAYFTEDNLIAVEGGGTITAVNAEGLAAPTTIVYQATGQSIADAFDEVHAYAQSILNGGSN